METIIQSQQQTEKGINSNVRLNFSQWFDTIIANFEEARFGWMAILMVAQSCLGSVACLYILQNGAGVASLTACVMVTMMTNSLLIAQFSAKWCLRFFLLSILLNTLFIVFNV